MPLQSSEFSLRRQVCEPIEILKQATSVNAAILKKDGELGVIAEAPWPTSWWSTATPWPTSPCWRIRPVSR